MFFEDKKKRPGVPHTEAAELSRNILFLMMNYE